MGQFAGVIDADGFAIRLDSANRIGRRIGRGEEWRVQAFPNGHDRAVSWRRKFRFSQDKTVRRRLANECVHRRRLRRRQGRILGWHDRHDSSRFHRINRRPAAHRRTIRVSPARAGRRWPAGSIPSRRSGIGHAENARRLIGHRFFPTARGPGNPVEWFPLRIAGGVAGALPGAACKAAPSHQNRARPTPAFPRPPAFAPHGDIACAAIVPGRVGKALECPRLPWGHCNGVSCFVQAAGIFAAIIFRSAHSACRHCTLVCVVS